MKKRVEWVIRTNPTLVKDFRLQTRPTQQSTTCNQQAQLQKFFFLFLFFAGRGADYRIKGKYGFSGHTIAGHGGNPFTLARTRSPTFHCCWAAAADATAVALPLRRPGAIWGIEAKGGTSPTPQSPPHLSETERPSDPSRSLLFFSSPKKPETSAGQRAPRNLGATLRRPEGIDAAAATEDALDR